MSGIKQFGEGVALDRAKQAMMQLLETPSLKGKAACRTAAWLGPIGDSEFAGPGAKSDCCSKVRQN